MGESLPQAMIAMKAELGHDSVLISHRKVKRGGVFGIGTKEYFEVIGERLPAWLVDEARILEKTAQPTANKNKNSRSTPGVDDAVGTVLRAARHIRRSRKKEWISDEPIASPAASPPAAASPDRRMKSYGEQLRGVAEPVHSEVVFLPKTRPAAEGTAVPSHADEKLLGELSKLREEVALLKNPSAVRAVGPRFEGCLDLYFRRLGAAGVDKKLSEDIVSTVMGRSEPLDWTDEALIRSRMMKEIKKRIKIARPLELDPEAPRVIVAVGATGVGKTTTLAKLGAILSQEEKRRVAFISLDYYRVGGADQLKDYSELMELPFEAVSSGAGLGDAINRNLDCEFIMIDTAGRSPYRTDEIGTLQNILRDCRIEPELMLFVSATTAESEMPNIIKNFSIMKNVSLVFSKIDEAGRSGSILNIASATGLPIAFLTTGQSVPDDIEPALASKLAEVLLETEIIDEPGLAAASAPEFQTRRVERRPSSPAPADARRPTTDSQWNEHIW